MVKAGSFLLVCTPHFLDDGNWGHWFINDDWGSTSSFLLLVANKVFNNNVEDQEETTKEVQSSNGVVWVGNTGQLSWAGEILSILNGINIKSKGSEGKCSGTDVDECKDVGNNSHVEWDQVQQDSNDDQSTDGVSQTGVSEWPSGDLSVSTIETIRGSDWSVVSVNSSESGTVLMDNDGQNQQGDGTGQSSEESQGSDPLSNHGDTVGEHARWDSIQTTLHSELFWVANLGSPVSTLSIEDDAQTSNKQQESQEGVKDGDEGCNSLTGLTNNWPLGWAGGAVLGITFTVDIKGKTDQRQD
mmetsp:Transcript_126337/g.178323  ORF Transcript_126337/g.178323 Transcript_126337/m.178323 type:complete len:300 (-) Transcript_126337:539-1438(-)